MFFLQFPKQVLKKSQSPNLSTYPPISLNLSTNVATYICYRMKLVKLQKIIFWTIAAEISRKGVKIAYFGKASLSTFIKTSGILPVRYVFDALHLPPIAYKK